MSASTSKRIVYTCKQDGSVRVFHPNELVVRELCVGGWSHLPRGFFVREIQRQIEGGFSADAARRFVVAQQFGGLTEAEAWAVFRDRDCTMPGNWKQDGILHEIHDAADLPDRWFRNAWTRSPNGGPVGLDLAKARRIQWVHIVLRAEAENRKRELDLFDARGPVHLNKVALERAIAHARDAAELRKVWPEDLSCRS